VSECDREASVMSKPCHTGGCCTMGEKIWSWYSVVIVKQDHLLLLLLTAIELSLGGSTGKTSKKIDT
jgi:hypothetical protein